jgi:hypothetical protein
MQDFILALAVIGAVFVPAIIALRQRNAVPRISPEKTSE